MLFYEAHINRMERERIQRKFLRYRYVAGTEDDGHAWSSSVRGQICFNFVMFIFDFLSIRVSLPGLLSVVNVNTPYINITIGEVISCGFKWCGSIIDVAGLFDFYSSRFQFFNRLRSMLLSRMTLHSLPRNTVCFSNTFTCCMSCNVFVSSIHFRFELLFLALL
jgi:hypothetical protein